jgi:hypothetical protein
LENLGIELVGIAEDMVRELVDAKPGQTLRIDETMQIPAEHKADGIVTNVGHQSELRYMHIVHAVRLVMHPIVLGCHV